MYIVNVISPSTTCFWIWIFVDPGTTFKSTNQILQFMSSLGLFASTSVLFTSYFPLIFYGLMG